MADPARSEERRELERRAFGPSGSGLTEAEAARLAELRRADASGPAPQGAPSDATMLAPQSLIEAAALRPGSPSEAAALPPGSLSEDAGGDRDETRRPSEPRRADPSPPLDAPDPSQVTPRTPAARVRAAITAWLASGRWKRPRYLLGGLIALVLVGVVIGVAIPRPPDAGLALKDGESVRRDRVLARADFDPGSVLLLARSDTALLWYATQSRGDLLCAIVDVKGAPPQHNCMPRRAIRDQPLDVTSQSKPGADGVVSGDHGTIALAGSGVPVGYLQHWSTAMNPDPGLSPEETELWKRITTENSFRATMIAGRVSGIPIWVGYREQGDLCVVVEDGETYKVCGEQSMPSASRFGADEDPPTLVLDLPATDAHRGYRLEYWTGFSSYLVITADPDPQPTPPFGLKPAA